MISTGKSIPYILKTPTFYPLDGIPLASIVRANSLLRLLSDFALPIATAVDVSDSSVHSLFLDDVTISDASISAIGTDVRISDIHCQVGSGIDISQGTLANMPDLNVSGVIQKEATGLVACSKISVGQTMSINSYTIPKNLTQISVWAGNVSPYVGSGPLLSFSLSGGQGYRHKQVNNQFQATSYGTTSTAINPNGVGIDYTKGVVQTMAHDDDAGDFNVYFNTQSDYLSVSSGRCTPVTTTGLFMNGGNNMKCLADIVLDGTEYAEIVHNRLLKIFYP